MQRTRKIQSPFNGTNGNIRAINTGRIAIHSALGIKPGAKLSGLSDKAKASLRNKLLQAKLLMIDEVSMVSSDLSTKIDARSQIYSTNFELSFSGLSVLIIGDYL